MTAAAEPNVEGSVTIAGGPCGAPTKTGAPCRAADEAGEGVELVFVAKVTGGDAGRVTAGAGGRFAVRLAPGEYELRLADGQRGALRLEGRTVRVPGAGAIAVDVRVEALRP